MVVITLIIVMEIGVAILWYLKKNSTTSLIDIVSDKVNALIGDNTDKQDDVTLNIRYEELLGEINQLKEVVEGFQEKQRQEALRRIIRREGAKLLAVTQPNEPSLLAQLPMTPVVPGPTGVLNESYQSPAPASRIGIRPSI